MTVKVADLMTSPVMTTTPRRTFEHVKSIMRANMVSAMPVVGPEEECLGIVTSTDLMEDHKDATPVGTFMTQKTYTIPQYSDISIAARMMRNHKIHHLIVTHEKKVVGIVSSFDLLALVEEKRYVAKNPPTKKKRGGGKRSKEELGASS